MGAGGFVFGIWIVNTIARAAARSDTCSVKEGVYSFRVHKAVGFIGAALLLISSCAVFLPHWIVQVIWLIVFLPIGLPSLLFCLVAKISIDEEKVTYRNMIGIKKQILWQDVKCAYKTTLNGGFEMRSGHERIWVSAYFCCHPQIRNFAERYCPDAFSAESILSSGCIPEVAQIDGSVYFGQQRFLLRVVLYLLVFPFGIAFIPTSSFSPVFGSSLGGHLMVTLIMLLPIILLLMVFLVPRLRVDNESIHYRNALGASRCISWSEVKSVEVVSNDSIQFIRVSNGHSRITASRAFCCYEVIQELIMSKIPASAKRIIKTAP